MLSVGVWIFARLQVVCLHEQTVFQPVSIHIFNVAAVEVFNLTLPFLYRSSCDLGKDMPSHVVVELAYLTSISARASLHADSGIASTHAT